MKRHVLIINPTLRGDGRQRLTMPVFENVSSNQGNERSQAHKDLYLGINDGGMDI